jgi:protein SCO1
MSSAAVFAALLLAPPYAPEGGGPELEPPPPVAKIGVDERIGEQIPLDLDFIDADDRQVRLADYFDGDRPVFLVLAYVSCEMLCSLVLRGAADAVRGIDVVPGEDYRVITVSIDPDEDQGAAAAKRRELLSSIGRAGERSAWTYLRGEESAIQELAAGLGFRYTWDQRTQQWAHPAVGFVLTPDGRVSRYFHGIHFGRRELSSALGSAAAGDTSASIGERVMSCFRFDPALQRYREQLEGYFRIGSFTVFTILGSLVVGLLVWERRRARRRRE